MIQDTAYNFVGRFVISKKNGEIRVRLGPDFRIDIRGQVICAEHEMQIDSLLKNHGT